MSSKIVVLGGGVSGLSAAYYLARNLITRGLPHEITLLEKGKLGGWMQTEVTDKSIFELGPRNLRTYGFVGGNAVKLADELGLADDMINVTHKSSSAQNRLIFARNKLNRLPSSLMQCLKTNPPLSQSLASIYMKGFFKEAVADAETVFDVVTSRFGEDVTKWYVDPFVRGVFAADCKELSLKAAFPGVWYMLKNRKLGMPRKPQLDDRLLRMQEHVACAIIDKVRREGWTQWNLEGGLVQFIDALEKGCLERDVKILKHSEVLQFTLQETGKMDVTYRSIDRACKKPSVATITNVDHVIATIPARSLSKILQNVPTSSIQHETLTEIGNDLSRIQSVDVGMVNLEFEGPPSYVLPQVGFGHLVPSCVESKVLGIVYDSCVFPEHDRKDDLPVTRLTCMMGGSWFNDVFGDPERVSHRDLEQAALESVSEQLGINANPLTMVTNLHKDCIPTYRVGHTNLVEQMEDTLKENSIPIHLAGSSYWGVSVNDCIYNSRYIADTLFSLIATGN